MENRIDTDLEHLILIDGAPTGDSLLDPILAEIALGEQASIRSWLERIADGAGDIRERALARLVALGILERQDDRFLWVFAVPALPPPETGGPSAR